MALILICLMLSYDWTEFMGWWGKDLRGDVPSSLELHQTWVWSPACSQANLMTPDCSEGNFSIYGKVPNAEPNKKHGQLIFKRPENRNAFQERVFKSKVKEQVTGWMVSSCMSFSLGGGEVSRWLFGWISIVNLLIPTSLGLPACGQHTVNFFHLLGVSISAVCAVLSHSVVSDSLGPHGL